MPCSLREKQTKLVRETRTTAVKPNTLLIGQDHIGRGSRVGSPRPTTFPWYLTTKALPEGSKARTRAGLLFMQLESYVFLQLFDARVGDSRWHS